MRTTRFNPIKFGMMDSTAMSSGGFGGYTGSDDDGGDDDNDDDLGGDDDSLDDDQITLEDGDDPFESLFTPDKDKENGESDDDLDDDDDVVFPTQEEVTEELKGVLEGYAVPEDLIPDDLDMSDRKQVRDVLTNVGRHAVQSALAAMFKPIQIAMNQQQHELRREIKTSVRGGFAQDKEEAALVSAIPAAKSKADRKVIDVLFTQAKTKHPKDLTKALQMTRQAMKAAGMNPDGRKTAGKTSGKRGLDLYAPRLPELNKPTSRNADRLRRPRS